MDTIDVDQTPRIKDQDLLIVFLHTGSFHDQDITLKNDE
jgi:hypothetical protein